MALDETQLERLVISLEANTSKLDTTIVKSSALLDRQLGAMESRTTTFAARLSKQFASAFGNDAGKAAASTLDQLTVSLKNNASALGPLGQVLATVGGGWLAAGAAAGGFAYLLEQGTEKLAEHERQLATVGGVLRATGAASGQTADSIEAMAERISGSTLQTREAVLQAATELLTFRNIAPEAFEPVLRYAADLSTVFGVDLPTAAKQLGKALDEPAQGLTALRRFGITFTADQERLIKSFADTGDIAKADGVILDALANKIGGASGAAHGGLSGAVHDLDEAWNRLLIDLAGGTHSADGAQRAINDITVAVDTLDKHIKAAGGLQFLAELLGFAGGGITGALAAASGFGTHPAPAAPHVPGQDYPTGPVDWQHEQAMFGPGAKRDQDASAQQQKQIDLTKAIDDEVTARKAELAEMRKSPLSQAIDRALKEAAEKAKQPVSAFMPGGNYAAEGAQIRQVAVAEYNLTEARKDGKKAAEEAKEAEKKRLEALSELAKGSLEVFKQIDELTAKMHGNEPGAPRAAFVREQTAGLSPDQQYLAPQKGAAAGALFDSQTLDEQITKGRDLVRNYQDQVGGLRADQAAAAADKFEHDALLDVYQKIGSVSAAAAAKVHAQAQEILAAGHAAEQASEAYRDQVQLTDGLREGLDRMAETGLNGFHGLRDAAKEFLQQIAEMIVKLYIMQPLLDAVLGKQGTAGGGLLGSGISSLFGGAASSQVENIGMTATKADFGQSSGGIGDFISSIGSFFGFAEGGKVGGKGNRDTVLARLTPDEHVMNRAAVGRYGHDLFDAMNDGTMPAFATGGPVGRVSVPRLPKISQPRGAGGSTSVSNTFHVDARGAQEGVADQIDAKLQSFGPVLAQQIMREQDRQFPEKLRVTLRDRG